MKAEDTSVENTLPEPQAIAAKALELPHLSGVYIFKQGQTVLYVGKAKDLKKRVSSYFRNPGSGVAKTRVLLGKADDIDYIITSTEKEALLLEASLIKKHRPRYNVILRDDKNYPALRIDLREPYPRLELVRRFQKDGALYFGPYPSAHTVRETLKVLNHLFPLRQCKGKKLVPRKRPCLNYSIGLCLGACAGKVDRTEYHKAVQEVVLFLQGKTDTLQKNLHKKMEDAARDLDFERAALYRDRLEGVKAILEKQRIVSDNFSNQDVLAVHQQDETAFLLVLFIRQGVLIGQKGFDLKDAQGEKSEILRGFIQQYYVGGRFIPDEIIVEEPLEDTSILQEYLSEQKGKRVRIAAIKRGPKRALLDLARTNAEERFQSHRKDQKRTRSILKGLKNILRLPRYPETMACVDISNIQGLYAVGAVVIFRDGQPDKESYRWYRVIEKKEPDDPAMMAEVIERFSREESDLFARLDLLMLDGGKGQLNRVVRLFKDCAIDTPPPLVAIAKEKEWDRGEKGRGLYEKIYVPNRTNPLNLSHSPEILHLLQRLRDEAHRFALSHYKDLHGQEMRASILDGITGIGPKRKQTLLRYFAGIDSLGNAKIEEIATLPGFSPSLAQRVVEHIRNELPENAEKIS